MEMRHGKTGIKIHRHLIVIGGLPAVPQPFITKRNHVVGARIQFINREQSPANVLRRAELTSMRKEDGVQEKHVRIPGRFQGQRLDDFERFVKLFPL
jgi:hypothetical protein